MKGGMTEEELIESKVVESRLDDGIGGVTKDT